jgi:hypothetical protein
MIETKYALWNGQYITYRPGKLHVALDRGVPNKMAYDHLVKAGCEIEYESNVQGVVDVVVAPKDTLSLAGELSINSLFRFVEPDILKRENFN